MCATASRVCCRCLLAPRTSRSDSRTVPRKSGGCSSDDPPARRHGARSSTPAHQGCGPPSASPRVYFSGRAGQDRSLEHWANGGQVFSQKADRPHLAPFWASHLGKWWANVQPEKQKGPNWGLSESDFGGGRGIRTPDLRVMSPTSYRCSIPRRLQLKQRSISLGLASV